MKLKNAIGLAAILAIAFILRPPVAAVGPLLPELRESLQLTALQTGLLTSLPVLCFGAGAFASPILVKRLGLDNSMTLLLALIAVGVALRVWFDFATLLASSVVIGLAIAVANVIMPTLVRERYPNRVHVVTGTYTTLLASSASIAAAVSVPLSTQLGGWRGSLVIWAVPALLALVLWFFAFRTPVTAHVDAPHLQREASALVWRSRVTWGLMVYFGLQSLGFYAMLSWMPTMLISRQYDAVEAGNYLAYAAVIGVPFGFALSGLYRRVKRLGWLAVAASAVTAAGFVVFIFQPRQALLACTLLGLGQASTFPISLALISTKAATAGQTTLLSSISQGFGYLLAAVGTLLFGDLGESLGWVFALWFLVALTVAQSLAALVAGGRTRIPANT